jgi:hypothetical protein
MSAVIRISSISSQVCSSSLPDESRLSSAEPKADWDLASRPLSLTIRPADGGGFSSAGAWRGSPRHRRAARSSRRAERLRFHLAAPGLQARRRWPVVPWRCRRPAGRRDLAAPARHAARAGRRRDDQDDKDDPENDENSFHDGFKSGRSKRPTEPAGAARPPHRVPFMIIEGFTAA